MNKSYVIVAILCCTASYNIITPKAHVPDSYTAAALSKDFVLSPATDPSVRMVASYRVLNNNGKVIGCIAPKKEAVYSHGKKDDPYEDAKAAYWSENDGVVIIDLQSYKSFAYAINDSNLIAGTYYKDSTKNSDEKSFLWDASTQIVKVGPTGHVLAMNDKNEILVNDKVWDAKNNIVHFIQRAMFENAWKPYLGWSHVGYINKKLNGILIENHDIYLTIDGKNKLLSAPQDTAKINERGDVFLNDNDEVVALTYKPSPTETIMGQKKKIFSITKWRKDGLPTTSEPISNIPALKDYLYDMDMQGFNNKGQVLILGKKSGNSNVNCMLFLLTPRA